MKTTVTADAKFLRRVFMALVAITCASGAMVALTTVNAKATQNPGTCLFFCE